MCKCCASGTHSHLCGDRPQGQDCAPPHARGRSVTPQQQGQQRATDQPGGADEQAGAWGVGGSDHATTLPAPSVVRKGCGIRGLANREHACSAHNLGPPITARYRKGLSGARLTFRAVPAGPSSITNAKPRDHRGALQDRHIAVASFRCVTATCAGVWLPASGSSCSDCHR